jgi:uncharacterized heparinase superfamily protein
VLTAAPAWFPIVDEAHCRRELIDAILEDRFEFSGEAYVLRPGFDWTANPSTDVEWLILLHKFYYAVGLGREWQKTGDAKYLRKWLELTGAWIGQVRVDFLTSDVAARRIQNWVSAWHYFVDAPEVPESFRRRFLQSLEAQADWLTNNLSPARNHRTLELLALFLVAVAFPEMPDAAQWLELARQAIVDNLCSDLRPDGVHCEQSTDYHHIVLRNALAVRRLARMNAIEMPEEFDGLIRKALEFALHVHRPDGLIPSLSDGDTGSFVELLEQGYELYGDERYRWVASQGRSGRAPAERLKAFPDGGYYILRSGWGEVEPFKDERYLVFDCGPLGEGNHGHFDLLSLELYGYGLPLIVDPGRYTYDESGEVNWRVAFRGTAFHNTVLVDGRNQTRYEFHRRKFKVRGPEPRFEMLGFGSRDGFDFVRGRAAGFEYDVVHEREIRMMEGNRFVVLDELSSVSHHRYEQIFHLTPAAENRVAHAGRTVTTPHLRITQFESGATCSIGQGWIAPVYGEKQSAPVVRFIRAGTSVKFETQLEVHP